MSEQLEIQNQFRNQQEKYTYYLIGLCVAAIGYSVNMTIGQELHYSQIPLGIALLCWGISCYCGLEVVGIGINGLRLNNI